jgi:hypothetical protein
MESSPSILPALASPTTHNDKNESYWTPPRPVVADLIRMSDIRPSWVILAALASPPTQSDEHEPYRTLPAPSRRKPRQRAGHQSEAAM